MLKKGDKVTIRPKAYPNVVYEGEVLRKTKRGFLCLVDAWGMMIKETYTLAEIDSSD